MLKKEIFVGTKIYFLEKRFGIYFLTQLLIIFGSIFFPESIYHSNILPFTIALNILAGFLIIKKKWKAWLALLLAMIIAQILYILFKFEGNVFNIEQIFYYSFGFAFNIVVTRVILKSVWFSKKVNKSVILGIIAGYLSIGLIAFYWVLGIEIIQPDSFKFLITEGMDIKSKVPHLIYYSFITLMSIGYGDIIPMTEVSQKVSILIGLVGQFYTVIFMGVIVGKFVNEQNKKK